MLKRFALALLASAAIAACGGTEVDSDRAAQEVEAQNACTPIFTACEAALDPAQHQMDCNEGRAACNDCDVRYAQCYNCKLDATYCGGCMVPSDCE